MKIAVALLVLTLAVASSATLFSEDEYQFLFTKWAQTHAKEYSSYDEFFKRFNVFKKNLDHIHLHSLKNRTHTLAMNKFGDLTNDEFVALYAGMSPRESPYLRSKNVAVLPTKGVPSSVDWPSKGVVTPVKNQGQCGSCWAFSTTGSVESAHAIATGKLVSLSEQELVDCSGSYGNEGCNGGLMDNAFEFIIANGGLCTEQAYPYQAVDGTCHSSSCTSAVTISSYQDVTPNDEDQLQAAVAKGPVSVAVDAAGLDWQFYSGGVLSDSCGTSLDHGVLAAGYGSDSSSSQAYWLVKNSWGADWGEQGYIRLLRGTGSGNPGECGIAMQPSYPVA